MLDECECDLVRDAEAALKIGGTFSPLKCECPNKKYKTVRISITGAAGFFLAWPAFVDVAMDTVGGCGSFGQVDNIAGEPLRSVSVTYNDITMQFWTFAMGDLGYVSTYSTFTGGSGFYDTYSDHSLGIATTSFWGCDPAALPGLIGNVVSTDGSAATISGSFV